MRSTWAGTVSFGLVSIPVRLYPAVAPREVAFRQVHTADGGVHLADLVPPGSVRPAGVTDISAVSGYPSVDYPKDAVNTAFTEGRR